MHRAFQWRGLGRRLVALAADHTRALGLASVTLNTFRDVAWNAPFYEKLGFRVLLEAELTPRLADILRHEIAIGSSPVNAAAPCGSNWLWRG